MQESNSPQTCALAQSARLRTRLVLDSFSPALLRRATLGTLVDLFLFIFLPLRLSLPSLAWVVLKAKM